MFIPWLTRAFIVSIFSNFILFINTNSVGIIGVYVAIAGISYMSGWKFPSKLILPLCIILVILKSL